jgi:hypothetical protein
VAGICFPLPKERRKDIPDKFVHPSIVRKMERDHEGGYRVRAPKK